MFGSTVSSLQAVYALPGKQHMASLPAEDRRTYRGRPSSTRSGDDVAAALQTNVFVLEHVRPALQTCATHDGDGNLKVSQPAQNLLAAMECLPTLVEGIA